jgi:hypothetical protein
MSSHLARMLAVTSALYFGCALAQTADQPKAGATKDAAEPMCGHAMMTSDERKDHMRKMHDANTPEQRDRYRKEHYEAMHSRAKERGVKWSEEASCRGPMHGSGRK